MFKNLVRKFEIISDYIQKKNPVTSTLRIFPKYILLRNIFLYFSKSFFPKRNITKGSQSRTKIPFPGFRYLFKATTGS